MRTGDVLQSRKTGKQTVKVAVLRKDVAQLHDTTTGRRWWTLRRNIPKSFVVSRSEA